MQTNSRKVAAFTLIELLVVIAVIIILAGLLFAGLRGAQEQARRTQAKNDLTQLITAVNAYYTEYGKYPIVASVGTPPDYVEFTTSNTDLLDVLRATQTGGVGNGANANNVLNPRKIVFIQAPDVKNSAGPRSGIQIQDSATVAGSVVGAWYDPWGFITGNVEAGIYHVRIDSDYNNSIPNPYSTGGAGSDPIPQGVIAWSLGKDGTLGTNGDGVYKNTTIGVQSEDVISWQ